MTMELREAIKAEHRRAELQRLDDGWAGCGCLDCQELYREIDLTRCAGRVVRTDGLIVIVEARRLKWDSLPKVKSDNATTDSDLDGDNKEQGNENSVTKIAEVERGGEGIMIQPSSDCTGGGNGSKRRGRPAKAWGEPVSRMTLWRRRRV